MTGMMTKHKLEPTMDSIDQWDVLNDGNSSTIAMLTNCDLVGGADVELDFGEAGQKANIIKINYATTNKQSINGCMLYVMDKNRKIIFEKYLSGVTDITPTIREFPIASPTTSAIIPTSEIALVRYLRLTRTSPGIASGGTLDYYMNVITLEGLLGTQTPLYCGYF
jgi:hypothetical protein